mmetsp:Transcript_46647/g.77151  ORF Transcript_46647/g.77151 Transcript_46647/m.77151 type:complete len:468 (+) Transcript_46647:131-1534(+)|eukprot:CAMPEP_0119336858 /NCGR_PEP_ID=MMETSP1333-20130426/92804_1 /TAXON_ID=418940 /ORGANISM="Scyphosphaera apsteinii, Strain RCC1455" /LENGTH=467 /DNA_ID=CAMNT_0007347763 /DNA_START=153 /DNA_END=1556 /DNA_ORIENTATION=-
MLADKLGRARPLPDHLLMPPFAHTYNTSKSTIIQTCASSPDQSLDYLRQWGIVSFDWSNLNSIWHRDHPMDSDVKLADIAARAAKAAPDTQIWVYRNLVIAYAEFVQIREKLEDPAYSGWFLPFGNGSQMPQCDSEGHCSDRFHTPSQRPGGDCGKIPCGWYVFDHRNGSSLRRWLVEELVLGSRYGLGNASISGFYLDDWYTADGPTEVNSFFEGTGFAHRGQEVGDLYVAWKETVWQAQQRVIAVGGFTWNNINCQLDSNPGYGGAPVDCPPCGLTKSEGYPHADTNVSAPAKPQRLTQAKEHCASWLRVACQEGSVLPRMPLLLSFTRNDDGRQFPLPSPTQDVATFLLVRGPYAWLGYGWLGCIDKYERPNALDVPVGVPLDTCHEVSDGVFTRRWSNATVSMDCNAWHGSIVPLETHHAAIDPASVKRAQSRPRAHFQGASYSGMTRVLNRHLSAQRPGPAY